MVKSLTPEIRQEVKNYLLIDNNRRAAAKKFGISASSVTKIAKEANISARHGAEVARADIAYGLNP
jgi:transposase